MGSTSAPAGMRWSCTFRITSSAAGLLRELNRSAFATHDMACPPCADVRRLDRKRDCHIAVLVHRAPLVRVHQNRRRRHLDYSGALEGVARSEPPALVDGCLDVAVGLWPMDGPAVFRRRRSGPLHAPPGEDRRVGPPPDGVD